MSAIPKELLDKLFAGESETLEFKTSIREPSVLARLVAAFANANGGTILIGVSEPPEVVGVEPDVIRNLYKAALRQIEPSTVSTSLRMIDGGDGMTVAAINIEKSSQLVLCQGGAYIRAGTLTRAMRQPEILQMLTQIPPTTPTSSHLQPQLTSQATLETIAKSLAEHTACLEEISTHNKELKDELKKANAPATKWKERAYGFVFGVVASLVAAAIPHFF